MVYSAYYVGRPDSSGRYRAGAIRRKPGTDTKFPAQFAGNWLSVPGFAPINTDENGFLHHPCSSVFIRGSILVSSSFLTPSAHSTAACLDAAGRPPTASSITAGSNADRKSTRLNTSHLG